ncbi:hypothetical protein M2459_001366 [Parabacteroides sp. PF5-5]|uniref:hypothetical protein n=1 Tax=unclassified Parabacteroides TaxID=2649774 RepID=UPI0024755E46|nr:MULTISPECIES: hypothetical protein [unclassified Parabacteroides]MDH6304630.1 hypothetical protein [Parabacteroides sp. PH5-39]MDH6315756.1 hypothetical protein [Parabacteroides sp. PF5-13]MDH6319416.1 hypothetical protein [Parabacteroides sp. PH5-13]MDH6323147.1 hypothetical protein [Parabacteroides sp. PH5-8]MDH6326949.1 hypothetical protein [Parabacteroides sp. PH5-41]
MSYLNLINNFWKVDEVWQFDGTDTRLYFLLLKIANTVGWDDNTKTTSNSAAEFENTDSRLAGLVGVSINTFKNSQKKLIKSGLISVELGGKKYGNKSRYQILIANSGANSGAKLPPNSGAKPGAYNIKTKTKNNNIPPTPPKGFEKIESKLIELEKKLQEKDNQIKELEGKMPDTANPRKPQKPASPLNKQAREVFEDHYRDVFQSDYYWSAKDAGGMSSILNKLKHQRKEKGLDLTDEGVLFALKALLGSITEGWMFENFSVPNINSKFNEIVSNAKSKANGGKKTINNSTGVNEEFFRNVAEGIARGLTPD